MSKNLDDVKLGFDICLITHSDLDGVGCAVLLKSILRDKRVFIRYASTYTKASEFVKEALEEPHWEKIMITDMSVTEELAEVIDKTDNRVLLIDHHPDKEYLQKYKWAIVRPSKTGDIYSDCGTSLVWKWLKDNHAETIDCHFDYALQTIEKFVETIRRYDLWLWKTHYNDKFAKDLNDYLGIVGFADFVNNMWDSILSNFKPLLSDVDQALLDYRQREIDNYIKGKIRKVEIREIEGYKVGCIIADRNLSELGNRMMEEIPEIDIAMMFNLDKEAVSMRSIEGKGVDCTKLAKRWFGGGGHELASGGELSSDIMAALKEILFVFSMK